MVNAGVMLRSLDIKPEKGAQFVPKVNFNAETGECWLEGESYLEDTWDFYDRLTKWLENYIKNTGGPIDFNFKLTYFNTSSSKGIMEIMHTLKEYAANGGSVTASWHHPVDDEDIICEGEDFVADIELEMNFVPYVKTRRNLDD